MGARGDGPAGRMPLAGAGGRQSTSTARSAAATRPGHGREVMRRPDPHFSPLPPTLRLSIAGGHSASEAEDGKSAFAAKSRLTQKVIGMSLLS